MSLAGLHLRQPLSLVALSLVALSLVRPVQPARQDKPRWNDPGTGPAAGTLDQFPVADEGTRSMGPDGDLDAEPRLLVDRYRDDP